jgi:hypothetical protein
MLRSTALLRRLGQAAAAQSGAAGAALVGGTGTTTTTTAAAAARAPALQSWLGGQQARRLTEEAKEAIERTLVVDTLATVRRNLFSFASWASARRRRRRAPSPLTRNPLQQHETKQAKKFESVGMDRRDAEAMTSYLTEQIVLDRGRLAEKFVHKSDLEKTLIEERALVAAFKAELSQKQDLHLATLHKDLERQQAYLEKIKADLRHEIDKLSASQRLDLNLEKGWVGVCSPLRRAPGGRGRLSPSSAPPSTVLG